MFWTVTTRSLAPKFNLDQKSCYIGPAVTSTTLLWAPRVLWTESTRSVVPKVADSNCGAENVPVFKIYFLVWSWLPKLGWSTYICGFRLAWLIVEQVNQWSTFRLWKCLGCNVCQCRHSFLALSAYSKATNTMMPGKKETTRWSTSDNFANKNDMTKVKKSE